MKFDMDSKLGQYITANRLDLFTLTLSFNNVTSVDKVALNGLLNTGIFLLLKNRKGIKF
jgi:hypothetical protein